MALVSLDNNKDLIKNAYLTLNLLTVIAEASAIFVWFFVPFLTENPNEPKHQIVRILSLFYTTGAGAIGLFGAKKLTRLDRYVTALEKAEDNNFIQNIATAQYTEQKKLEGESEYQIVLAKSENGMLPPTNEEEYEDNYPEYPKEINGIKLNEYHWEALAIAREKGELSPRELQRSGLGQRLSLKADSAKEILNDLANANLGKLEEEGEKIKFLPLS